MSAACGSEKDLWSEQISKIVLRFFRFARSSLLFGGEAAELQPEFTLIYAVFTQIFSQNYAESSCVNV
jgi:hypothetical protein